MKKIAEMDPLGETRESVVALMETKLAGFSRWSQAMGLNPKVTLGVTCVGLICSLGWLHLATRTGLIFDYFYLLVCVVAGWAAGFRAAFVCALVSAGFILLAERTGLPGSSPLWLDALNSFIRLAAFAAIGRVAAESAQGTRHLERTVEERTERVQKEVERHEETSALLRQSLEIQRQITENVADVFWVTDPARTRFEYVSIGFERVWGKACEELYESAKTWIDGVYLEDRERVREAIASKQTLGLYDEEYRVMRADGVLRWVHDRAFPVKDEHRTVHRLVGIAEDITERKRSEHLLRSQRDMGEALSSTSDLRFAISRLLDIALQLEGIDCGGVYLMDQDTGELHLEAHRGLSEPFLKRVSHYKSTAFETQLARAREITYATREQIPRSLEVFWGSEGLRSLAMAPVQQQGSVLGLLSLGSYRNDEIPPRTRVGIEMISAQVAGAIARIRAENALRRSEAHLRSIINHAPIALVAVDAQGRITFEDGQALRAMDVQPGEHVRNPVDQAYREFPVLRENFQRALAGEEFTSVLELARRSFECRFMPFPEDQTGGLGCVGVAVDITERTRLQREILEISDREQARLGQDIHDGLCQQLIGMAFTANSLEKTISESGRPEAAGARKICRLLDEAITESRRVCRGLYPIRLETHGLWPALEELAAGVRDRHKLDCVFRADGETPACDVATATHLYRIAQEAVNNAVKHSGGQSIQIEATRPGENFCLSIRDNGKWAGAAPDGPSGMGMHIMEYRARLLGGTLEVSHDADGTFVCCRLPAIF